MKIRRPLCFVGLGFAAAVVAVVLSVARGAPTYEALDRERVVVAGYVEQIEYRMSREEKVPVISLSDAAVLKESHISSLEQFLSSSEKISQHRLHIFWKENREELQREDTGGIVGVICYVDGEEIPQMGSFVIMQGDFRAFVHATNFGEFDAADYYQIMGQQGKLADCRILAQSSTYSVFQDAMYRVKEYLSLLADACFDEKDASVMKAMLLGEKGTIDAGVKELYQQNGIIHILAISGVKTDLQSYTLLYNPHIFGIYKG